LNLKIGIHLSTYGKADFLAFGLQVYIILSSHKRVF